MLTKKQQRKLNEMTKNYIKGLHKAYNVVQYPILSWVAKYKITMSRVLRKQDKR